MIVIAVVAVLASLLIPSLQRTMQCGLQVQCMNNIKSISLATGVYQHDYADYFPYGIPLQPGTFTYNDFAKGKPTQELLLEYLSDPKSNFICPSDEKPEGYWYWKYTDHPNYTKVAKGSSYMFSENAILGMAIWTSASLHPDNIKQPSTFGFMSEGWAYPNAWNWRTVDPNYQYNRIKWSHLGSVNFMFGDSHVESVFQLDAPLVRSDPLQ